MIRQLSVHDVKSLLDGGETIVLIDVRQPEEYGICRLEGSTLIPLGDLIRRAGEVEPPPGSTVVVYCHHGIRSITGAHLLAQAGVENVASMTGGIDAWSLHVDPSVPRY